MTGLLSQQVSHLALLQMSQAGRGRKATSPSTHHWRDVGPASSDLVGISGISADLDYRHVVKYIHSVQWEISGYE